ncbi:dihydrodipicolinate synthase [Colletotrichum scovillei]|uniref:Dihydrodipicolinate synthase n=1 Tax=Colletotrichum scovillei TaxID=1209932 RepID=A0A9P7RAN1_9PEZI|nr:dihydrodipicolinate synthase [Colletotrichum scovillei]KAG7072194.1 dihydrodipicolinate synthase [Colletotrichum scovillei]KAG7080537.1 dihydrodipicolinate synthase [Colletotrichum scovillei]
MGLHQSVHMPRRQGTDKELFGVGPQRTDRVEICGKASGFEEQTEREYRTLQVNQVLKHRILFSFKLCARDEAKRPPAASTAIPEIPIQRSLQPGNAQLHQHPVRPAQLRLQLGRLLELAGIVQLQQLDVHLGREVGRRRDDAVGARHEPVQKKVRLARERGERLRDALVVRYAVQLAQVAAGELAAHDFGVRGRQVGDEV